MALRLPTRGSLDAVLDAGQVFGLYLEPVPLVRTTIHGNEAAANDVIIGNDDEATGAGIVAERVEGYQAFGAKHDFPHHVALHPVGFHAAHVGDVDDVLDRPHRDGAFRGVEFQLVAGPHPKRRLAEPENPRSKHIAEHGHGSGVADDLPPLHEDLMIEANADRPAGPGGGRRPARRPILDRLDPGLLVGGLKTISSPTFRRPVSTRPTMIRRSSDL